MDKNTDNFNALISIHAPREGGDPEKEQEQKGGAYISIHAPREGGDKDADSSARAFLRFQSTPPARGATDTYCREHIKNTISIPAPREGGDGESQYYKLA